MNTELVGLLAGAVLGVAWTAIIASYLFYTRSYRRTLNQFVIRFGQLLVGILGIGSLLLLASFWEHIGILRRSSAYYASLYAFAFTSGCGIFFAVRAEIRWRKSVGL